jgi:hypothetical protein
MMATSKRLILLHPISHTKMAADTRHSVGEVAQVDADERALLCPGQLFLTALHDSGSALTLSLSPSRLPRGK